MGKTSYFYSLFLSGTEQRVRAYRYYLSLSKVKRRFSSFWAFVLGSFYFLACGSFWQALIFGCLEWIGCFVLAKPFLFWDDSLGGDFWAFLLSVHLVMAVLAPFLIQKYRRRYVEKFGLANSRAEGISYFYISEKRVFWLSLLSFGIYNIYWNYRQWKEVREKTGEDILPLWRGIFNAFWLVSLGKRAGCSLRQSGADEKVQKQTVRYAARSVCLWVIDFIFVFFLIDFLSSLMETEDESLLILYVVKYFYLKIALAAFFLIWSIFCRIGFSLCLAGIQKQINSYVKNVFPDKQEQRLNLSAVLWIVLGAALFAVRGKAFYFSSVMFLYYSLLGLDFPKQLEDGAWKKIYTTLYVRWIGPYQYCEKNYPGTVGLYYNAFAKQEEESIALIQSFLTQRGKDLIEEVNKAAASSEEIREMFEKNKKWTLLLINLANLHQQTGLPIEEIPWDEKYKETLAWDDKAYCEGLSLHADFILGYKKELLDYWKMSLWVLKL